MTPEFYNATEAARALGVSDKTISRRLKKLPEPFPSDPSGGYQIPAEWVMSQPEWTTGHHPDTVRTSPGHCPDKQPDNRPDNRPDMTGQTGVSLLSDTPDTPTGHIDRTALNRPDMGGQDMPDTSGTEMVVHLAAIEHHKGEAVGISVEDFLAAMQQMIETNRELVESNAALSKRVEELKGGQAAAITKAVAEAFKSQNVQSPDEVKQIVSEAVSAEVKPLHAQIEDVKNTTGDGLARMSGAMENLAEQPVKRVGLWARLFGKG